ncbi:unnamed protein product [Ilex paraguariensis]|uniref:Uncharacterized protein n=1 Tax=Ilex paraguariensis TaxID=185542 RepID=A0ABC8UQU7_9AQUA
MFWAVSTEQNTTSHDDLSLLEVSDKFLEHILRKIETIDSRVHKLKAQLDLVMSKNAGKFSSSENLSHLVPCDAQTSSVHSPTFSANADTLSVGGLYTAVQHVPEYDMGELVMPETAVSSYGDAFCIPDITESTAGFLSSVAVTQHQPQIGDSCENKGGGAMVSDDGVAVAKV